MHVVLTGTRGQLGRALRAEFEAMPGVQLTCWGHGEQDISQPAIAERVARLRPDLVLNAAAWTNVDGAEAQAAEAFAANALGPLYLAEGCAACNAALVQVSTNEVFAGEPGRTYTEYDAPHPQGVYARSKAAGELAASRVLRRLYIVRVAWLFGLGGNHFPAKMIGAADRHGALRVVANEFGNPTYAPDVAAALGQLVQMERYGIYHLVNEGQASRFEFAQATLALSGRGHVPLTPIRSDEWPRPAPPPLHAVLINHAAARLGIVLRPWQEALAAGIEAERERFAVAAYGAQSRYA
jgi:dTDP-4-dehydrorhamnose reductase